MSQMSLNSQGSFYGGSFRNGVPATGRYRRRVGSFVANPLRAGFARSRSYGYSRPNANFVRARGFVRNVKAAALEKKGMDTDLSLTPVIATTTTNASSFVLNLVQQGAGSWNRVGRKILNRSLRIKGVVKISMVPTVATGASQTNFLRMVYVWDQQPSGGAIPTFDTIFGITSQDGTESCPDVTCPPRYDNMDRFKVLHDRTYDCNTGFVMSSGTAPSNSMYFPVDEFFKLGDKETVFSGQSNPMTIADISTGAIYCFLRAAVNDATTFVGFDGTSRLRYMN